MTTPPQRMYMCTVTAPTNIAVIKYWGKASVEHNTPTNSSLSVTLDQSDLRAVTTVATSPDFTQDCLWLNGKLEEGAQNSKRFRACVDGVKALATDKVDGETRAVVVSKAEWQEWKVHVSSYNTFPTAAGLASSAAGYAALVAALTELYQAQETFDHQLSTIARQGSGSSCRSLYGGFVAWRQGSAENDWKDSLAQPVAPVEHWPEIRAVILVTNAQKKHTSSTTGMQNSVRTSPFLKYRGEAVVPQRMHDMERAWLAKDFDAFAKLTMQDSNQFHSTCLDTYPPIFYLNDTSRDIIRLIHAYNDFYATTMNDGGGSGSNGATSLRVAYTFDAGPNAVLYTTAAHVQEVLQLVQFFFPEPSLKETNGQTTLPYVRGMLAVEETTTTPLDEQLVQYCQEQALLLPTSGKVQYMYVTQSGPGPQVLLPCSLASDVKTDGDDQKMEINLDPTTGLNTYVKS